MLLVTAIYWGAIWGMGQQGLRRPMTRIELGRSLAHTLVPIAAAYVVAHYFSLLAYNGQDIVRLASDPLGDGSDLFGGADRRSTTPSSPPRPSGTRRSERSSSATCARSCSAHDRALALYEDPKAAYPIADRHADPDGVLHLPRALPALGLEPMIVFAHAGHWLVSLAYVAPLLFLIGIILVGKVRDRREERTESKE